MDTDTLISKVFLKPAIWDKRLKVYTNIEKTVPHLLSVEEKGGDIHHTVLLAD